MLNKASFFLSFFQCLLFHVNPVLTEDSHLTTSLFFYEFLATKSETVICILKIKNLEHYEVYLQYYVVYLQHYVVYLQHYVVYLQHYVVHLQHYVVHLQHFVVYLQHYVYTYSIM